MMKGALQVSIGFIIIMVISALILIFALSWLGQMWGGMITIGEYMTGQAQQAMMDNLRSGNDVVLSTFPYSQQGVSVPRGSIVSFMVGIKKIPAVENEDEFIINIEDMDGNSVSENDDITFTYRPNIRIAERDGSDMVKVDMTIASNAPVGVYGYTAYVCTGGNQASCDTRSDNHYGDTDFIVHVE